MQAPRFRWCLRFRPAKLGWLRTTGGLQAMDGTATSSTSLLHFVMIKPSHYDDDGYPIQWLRSAIPSNTLAVLNGLARDCASAAVLGDDVEIRPPHLRRDQHARPAGPHCPRRSREQGGRRWSPWSACNRTNFLAPSIWRSRPAPPACRSASAAFMSPAALPCCRICRPNLREARRWASRCSRARPRGPPREVLRDAWNGTLQAALQLHGRSAGSGRGAAADPSARRSSGPAGITLSFDAGRGCPFQCSFCTIINVQGRKVAAPVAGRCRADRAAECAQGIQRFFITDDNFARNRDWEKIFDRLIELREGES